MTVVDAASEFGFSEPLLCEEMKKHGIESPYWVRVRPDPADLRRLYADEGLGIREIAVVLGFTYEVIRKDLIKAGVPLRPSAFDPLGLPVKPELDGCWVWTGARNRAGYGQVSRNGSNVSAHRWVYKRMRGPIPPGLVLDHLCYNPPCVNPDHLEAVTQEENLRRAVERRRRLRKEQYDACVTASGNLSHATPMA